MCGFMRRPQRVGTFVPIDAFFLWTFSFLQYLSMAPGSYIKIVGRGEARSEGRNPCTTFSLVLPPPPMRTQHYFIVLLRLFSFSFSLWSHTFCERHAAVVSDDNLICVAEAVVREHHLSFSFLPSFGHTPLPLPSPSRSLSSWTPAISCVTQSRYMRKRVHACMHAYVHGKAWHTTTGALLFQPSPSFFSPLPFPLLHFRSATLPCSLGKEERGREWWSGKTYSPLVLPLPLHPYPRVLPSFPTYMPTHIPRVLLSSLPPPSQVDWAQGRPSGT